MFGIKDDNKGFSLSEVMVAIAIFSTATTAIFYLVLHNIQTQKNNKDFLVASMLAQEGLELVRNLRDKNWLSTTSVSVWEGITDSGGDKEFAIDYTFDIDWTAKDTGGDDIITDEPETRLYVNSNGFYDHGNDSGDTETKFYRLIKIDDSGGANKIEVTAIIGWEDFANDKFGVKKSMPRKYVASTELYDWRY